MSFLHTAYFDAVELHHEPSNSPSYSLVAEDGNEMLGVLEATVEDGSATINTIARGFAESDLYLQVYANMYGDAGEPKRAIESAKTGLYPVIVFSHADLTREADLRSSFERVHVCRRFDRTLWTCG